MKPRSDSVIEAMPPNQKEALESWLCEENVSYLVACERLKLDFNVRSSPTALKRFYQRCMQRRLKADIFGKAQFANEVKAEFRKSQADFSEPLLQLIGQMAFEQAVNGRDLDPKFFVQLSSLLLKSNADTIKNELKAQALGLEERRVKLLEEKAARADAAESTLKDGGLSAEEKQLKLREIFHLA